MLKGIKILVQNKDGYMKNTDYYTHSESRGTHSSWELRAEAQHGVRVEEVGQE